MAGIYIHIPFCRQACYYCDFHFSTNLDLKEALVRLVGREIEMQKQYLEGEEVETIYFGGGTPTLLQEHEINFILESIHSHFEVAKTPEITIEANPEDLTLEKLTALKKLGINRLSIGIQSFDEQILRFFNRNHSATEAIECIADARSAGFNNINVDLIYAVPGQTDEQWKKNLEQAIALSPEHLSAYTLTIEDKTVFGKWLKSGKLKTQNEDVAASQMEILMDTLDENGFVHYEISNFCKEGFFAQHNSNYWRQKKYLGVGPSAHSYNGSSRQRNIGNNALYIKSLEKNEIPFELEVLYQADNINDYLLTSLRTMWGCRPAFLKKEFGFDLMIEKKKELDHLIKLGLLETRDERLTLTRQGKFLADKIAQDLFTE